MASILKRYVMTVLVLNFMVVCCSSCAAPPSVEPPSYLELPRLCNYTEFFKYGEGIFDDIESCNVGLLRRCNLHQIYQLGDSISDVGNLIRESNNTSTPFAALPYGESFPEGPTGRASNGKLIIDYLALDAGLSLVPPFKKSDADFSHGVNFAVAGSTALPPDVLANLNITSTKTNNSLSVQLEWMSSYFHSLSNINQRDSSENALFIVGPFGGSDYYHALFQGKTMREIRSKLMPKVVDAIMDAVRRVVGLGATRVVVPGLYTISDLPFFQMIFTGFPDMYESYDDIALYHNSRLTQAIEKFNQEERPNAIVVSADFYDAYQTLFYYSRPARSMDTRKTCCGSGDEQFNLDLTRMCGAEGVSACADPDLYFSWDGMHLTQEAYRIMSKYIIYNMFFDLHCPNLL